MKIFGFTITKNEVDASKKALTSIATNQNTITETKSYSAQAEYSSWQPVNTHIFDGEKNPGELGNPINLIPSPELIRYRAYEQELKSDIIKTIVGKFFKWVVGNGLELQCQPNEIVLAQEGITTDFEKFRTITENRFKIYSNSKKSDYKGLTNLHRVARDVYKTAFLGGDCLCIMRYENGTVTTQAIDGQEIVQPLVTSPYHQEAKERGNIIKSGIEVDKRGCHVAFYVRVENGTFLTELTRIPAKGEKSGKCMAFMVYGSKHRINHVRGISNLASILEKVEKVDRYTEATVSSAEERAKIVYAITHPEGSQGVSPVLQQLKQNISGGTADAVTNPYDLGETLAPKIAVTTNKQTFNLPNGSDIKSLVSTQETNYPDFFRAVFDQICAAQDIPPEVALQKYDSNYSASRAAINGWGYIIDIIRKDYAFDFYKKVYEFWLEIEIIKNKIPAPGYLKALVDDDYMIVESYSNCRFTGSNLPHIDPKKEVDAIRRMLGDKSKGEAPLISHERAAELLNQGEWSENIKKYDSELSKLENTKIELESKIQQNEKPNNENKG